MRHTILLTIIIMFLLSSCTEKKSHNETIPEAFQDNKTLSDWSSLKRGYTSIVDQLYEELCEKKKELKQMEEDIKVLKENEIKKTETIRSFFTNNDHYYNSALSMTEQITDSVLKVNIQNKVQAERNQFLKNQIGVNQFLDSLQKRADELNDQHIVLKLYLTTIEIEKYQSSFITDTSELKGIIGNYDLIIQSIKDKIKE